MTRLSAELHYWTRDLEAFAARTAREVEVAYAEGRREPHGREEAGATT